MARHIFGVSSLLKGELLADSGVFRNLLAERQFVVCPLRVALRMKKIPARRSRKVVMNDPQQQQQQQQQQRPPPDPATFEDQEDNPSYTDFSIDGIPSASLSDCAEDVWDIGHLALWTLSSAKPGHGLEALRSEAPELYWQSVSYLSRP
jgi:hypothetical protein